MSKNETKPTSVGIPQQINEQLLKQLESEKLPVDVVKRLKGVLLKEGGASEAELKKALFSDDQVT